MEAGWATSGQGASDIANLAGLDDAVATEAARRYAVRALPRFVVFSAGGREIYRESGRPDTERIKRKALSPG